MGHLEFRSLDGKDMDCNIRKRYALMRFQPFWALCIPGDINITYSSALDGPKDKSSYVTSPCSAVKSMIQSWGVSFYSRTQQFTFNQLKTKEFGEDGKYRSCCSGEHGDADLDTGYAVYDKLKYLIETEKSHEDISIDKSGHCVKKRARNNEGRDGTIMMLMMIMMLLMMMNIMMMMTMMMLIMVVVMILMMEVMILMMLILMMMVIVMVMMIMIMMMIMMRMMTMFMIMLVMKIMIMLRMMKVMLMIMIIMIMMVTIIVKAKLFH